MSCVNKWLMEKLQLPIQSLQTVLNIEGTGGVRVLYYGIVECQLSLPRIEGFERDVLMLVIDDSPYGNRVPIQLGTLHIDMILKVAAQDPTIKLGDSWERARLASSLKMGWAHAELNWGEVDLDQWVGNVINTQKTTLEPFVSCIISGTMRGPIRMAGISKRVNVLTEPTEAQLAEGSWFSAVPSYTYVSPSSCRVQVMIKNLTARPVTVGKGQMVAVVKPANKVPKMLALTEATNKNESAPKVGPWETSPEEGPQIYLKQGVMEPSEQKPLSEVQFKKLYDQLQLEKYTSEWEPELKTELKELMWEYSFLLWTVWIWERQILSNTTSS